MDYVKAKNQIRKLILEEKYAVGDKIPSINKLVKLLGVGKISAQNAVKQLEEEGILENIPRSGCYVKRIPDDDAPQAGGSAGFGSMFASSFMRDPRKKIRIGVLSDLSVFSHLWKKTFLEYMKEHSDVNVELIPVSDLNALFTGNLEEEFDIFQIPCSYLRHFLKRGAVFDLAKIGDCCLDEKSFYKGFVEGARYDGRLWGVPLVCAATCLFYNKDYKKFVTTLKPEDGFWAFLENAESGAPGKRPEAAFNINQSLYDLVKLISKDKEFDFGKMKYFEDGIFDEFVKRFEPYFRNGNVTAPFFASGGSVHEASTNNFFGRKAALTLSCSSSIVEYSTKAPFKFGILPLSMEMGGFCNIDAALNVISSRSRYPMECCDILKYLESFEVQSYFAGEGRLVAHKKANEHLNIKDLDVDSHKNLIRSVERGIVEKNNGFDIAEFTHTIAFYEMKYWQRGDFDADEFLRRLRQKARFFFESRKFNVEEGKITEKAI